MEIEESPKKKVEDRRKPKKKREIDMNFFLSYGYSNNQI
jgi:hypothetical protein